MDTIPANDPMQNPPPNPLGGLDPADLLKQGVAEDTFMDGAATSFGPLPIEDLAAIFPQFEILELIGKGGMGAVYKVRQRDLDRIVALKILPPAIGQSPEFSNRFTREAKALAKLNHPGIVTIHEFGQQCGLYFILMEFVDGVNLAQLMKTGRISPREALAIVPQICDALQYAHDQGIVHRDIKPENILLDRLGRVKVADFGIAKVVAAVCEDPIRSGDIPVLTDQTIAGKIIGTPQYMAPEQIDHPSDVDHRADIYALGVVFYQMLTGELPGKRLEAPSKKVHIDVRLDEIVLRAMEKNPELRFQQASVMKTRVNDLGGAALVDHKAESISAVEKVKDDLHMPAVGLGIVGAIFLGLAGAGIVMGVLSSTIWQGATEFGLVGWISLVQAIFPLVVGLVLFLSSRSMRRLRGYGMSVAGCVLSLFTVIGTPFGIWGLIILTRRKVRDAFGYTANEGSLEASATKMQVDERGKSQTKPGVPPTRSRSTGEMTAVGCGVVGLVGVLLMVALGTVFWLYSMKKDEAVERQVQAAKQTEEAIRAEAQIRRTEPGLHLTRHEAVRPTQIFTLERGGPLGGVDLDTGKFVNYEPTGGIDDPSGAVRWREENGIDLILDRDSASPGVLITGTQVMDVAPEWWDETPEAIVVEAVLPPWEKKSLFDERMAFLAAEGSSSGTRTHVYRTLAGSVGILRLGPTHSAGGVRAEWRMIVDRHPAEKATESPVLIVLLPDREPSLMGEQVSEEYLKRKLLSLKQQNPDLAVVVRADERVGYARISEMLNSLAKLGITNVAFGRASGPPQADLNGEQAPQLRRLDWQDQVDACAGDAWLPSGEVDASNDWMPPIQMVVSETSAAKERPRFLSLWISHPQFDAMSLIELKLLDADGKNPLITPSGDFAFHTMVASPENAGMGWITATLCAGKKGGIPPRATVFLRYSADAWQFWNDIAADFHGTQALGNGVMMNGPGQDVDGHAFVQITRDSSQDTGVEQFDFAAITKDGRRLERTGYGISSSGKVTIERFPFDTPLAQVKSFECRKRPVHLITWPVVLKEVTNTSGKMKIDFDRSGDSMQNILYNFRRKYDVRVAFENLDFDAKEDAVTLGRRISMLEEKQRGGKLTARETELLKEARRLRKEEKLGDETLIDVGARFEGVIKADSVEDFLNQLTKGTSYDWTMTDGRGTWVVLPRAGSRLNYPVNLDTANLTVEEAVKQVVAQRPARSEISCFTGEVGTGAWSPGRDSKSWLHVKCKPAKFQGIPAWRALSMIGEGARPDSVWELAGYKEHRMLALAPGTSVEHAVVAEAQSWLLTVDRGGYPKSHELASEFFHRAITSKQWAEELAKFRKPLGEMISRKLLDAESAKSLPGAPDGEYVVMQFDTSFAAKEKAVETVTFMKEPDGTWKAAGYFIK